MLKLTHIYLRAAYVSLMDYYEKALYNHILASQNHEMDDVLLCSPAHGR